MMYGPEAESGSLAEDLPLVVKDSDREKAHQDADRVVNYIKQTAFPLVGA
jgi:hypothetical protein